MDIDEATHFVLEKVLFFPPAAAAVAAGAAAVAIHILPCGPSMMDYPETFWIPSETGRGGFRQVAEFFISMIFFQILFC